MSFNWIKYSGLCIVLILFQVLVFNHILFQTYLNPYLYLVLLLMLPMNLPKQGAIVLGFLIGLTIDFFSDSAGLHAGACTLMMYVRSYLVRIIKTKEDYDGQQEVNVFKIGFQSFLTYASILLLVFHLYLFILESFSFANILGVIWKAIYSAGVSLILILLVQYLFIQSKNR